MQSIFKKVPPKYSKPKPILYHERFKHYLLGLLEIKKTKTQVREFARNPSSIVIGEEESAFTKQIFTDFLTRMTLEERLAILKELEESGVV